MNVFESVKAGISTREAAGRYGVEVDRHGKALCPFHGDRYPSMLVDDDHYHCFACGEHGDVIDFTAKLYVLSLYDAAKKLADDFGIMPDKPPTQEMKDKLRKRSEAQQLREKERLCFLHLSEYCRLLQHWKEVFAPQTPEDEPDARFVEACHRLDYVEYLVDLLIGSNSYERTKVIDMMMTDGTLQKLQTYLENVKKEDKTYERRIADLTL